MKEANSILLCSECGCPIEGKKEGWYYCPECDDMRYFMNEDD